MRLYLFLLLGAVLMLFNSEDLRSQNPGYLGKTFTIEGAYGAKLIWNTDRSDDEDGKLIRGVARVGVNYAFHRYLMLSLRVGRFSTTTFEYYSAPNVGLDVKSIALEINMGAPAKGFFMPLGGLYFLGLELQSASFDFGDLVNPEPLENHETLYITGGLVRRNLITDSIYWKGRASTRFRLLDFEKDSVEPRITESLKLSNYFDLEFGLGILLF